ncbi:hypothetical protein TNCV_1632481 [Trichonephila clavipes]|nr:hypothetical protein TNCV_1632481 [Trichonephila clavipes]
MSEGMFVLGTFRSERMRVLYRSRQNDRICVIVNRCPTRRVLSGTGIELVTKPATIRYLYHSATAATEELSGTRGYEIHQIHHSNGPTGAGPRASFSVGASFRSRLCFKREDHDPDNLNAQIFVSHIFFEKLGISNCMSTGKSGVAVLLCDDRYPCLGLGLVP